jgi:hypothetical protein
MTSTSKTDFIQTGPQSHPSIEQCGAHHRYRRGLDFILPSARSIQPTQRTHSRKMPLKGDLSVWEMKANQRPDSSKQIYGNQNGKKCKRKGEINPSKPNVEV